MADEQTDNWICVDGNEAAARAAYQFSEVIPIYPITPSSPMAESCDDWAAQGKTNVWGDIPQILELQSEAGAAGVLHGAVQKGTLGTTFTASQGLLLMIPNMFKIAGELTPAVMHVTARTVATHALSIFGDQSDVMACRSTGWVMLCSSSVQEAHDFAAISHLATLKARLPFLHFFDGFRTSHEVNRIQLASQEQLRSLVDDSLIVAMRERRMSSDIPSLRGTAQNPDVFFQGREAQNGYFDAVPSIVQETMDAYANVVGRQYHLVDYVGPADATRVVVLMGSGVGATEEALEMMNASDEKVGMIKIRLFRPFPTEAFLNAIPDSVTSMAVLDRTKEPGSVGEPLYEEVLTVLAEAVADGRRTSMPRIIAGRYGLSSKEFTPAMVKATFDELASENPKREFTVGIYDDVTNLSLNFDPDLRAPRAEGEVQAMFFGLGADGTVGANKQSVKIIGEGAKLFSQGYFVYDSKKSGAATISHLRFGPKPITSTYLIQDADFVACHQFNLIEKLPVLANAREGATFLLNSPYPVDKTWDQLPYDVQRQIIDKHISVYVIDAYAVAGAAGMGNRINTVMQPCFFKLSGVLPEEEAITRIKASIEKSYGKRGRTVVERNFAAVDASLAALHKLEVPTEPTPGAAEIAALSTIEDDFVKNFVKRIEAGEGDLLPVSAMPVDGVFPTATTKYEKRCIAQEIPIWDPSICIDCGKCAIVCPHAAIRLRIYDPQDVTSAPDTFQTKDFRSKDLPGKKLTVQVAPDDCTGCGVCVDVCPAKSKTEVKHKAINMSPVLEHRETERANWDFFTQLPPLDRTLLPHDSVKTSQVLEPLFEFSGACSGCGETPYVKLLSQLFGDRIVVANATGCSSIYGGNLPTTPWAKDAQGRGPAWNNSLFEDNAEFGLGLRAGQEMQQASAQQLVAKLRDEIGAELGDAILNADQSTESGIHEQRARVANLKDSLASVNSDDARRLIAVADELVDGAVWIIGGDGWAYDIGFGGLDHVLATGRNVNILVLDTEVYSNTGGQASKATPRGAVAKFAAAGKGVGKKDLGAIAMSYGNVYVAQISMGANDTQAVKAFTEAAAWHGPSIIIAYSTCIAHGIDMSTSMTHQKNIVKSGYWPLYRYKPSEIGDGQPFKLDSKAPSIPVKEVLANEARFAILTRTNPSRADELAQLQQADINERWRYYEQLANVSRTVPNLATAAEEAAFAATDVSSPSTTSSEEN